MYITESVLKRCFLFFLFCYNAHAQDYSHAYLKIKNDSTISNSKIEIKLDSLLNNPKTLNNPIIINDLYDYAKWHYYNTKNLDKAIAICKKAVLISEDFKKKEILFDEEKLNITMSNIGFFYERQEKYNDAFNAYKLLSKKLDPDKASKVYFKMGNCKRALGDYYEAIDYYDLAINTSKNNNIKDLVDFTINASLNLRQINTTYTSNRGIDLLNNALSYNLDSISPTRIIQLYDNLGSLYSEQNTLNFLEAKSNYEKAIEIALKHSDSLQLGFLYNNMGFLYNKVNNPEAINYLNKAQDYIKDDELLSIFYSNKAKYYSNRNDKENTLLNIQQAIKILTPFNSKELSNNSSKEVLFLSKYKTELLGFLIEKAQYLINFRDLKNPDQYLNQALKTLTLADDLADNIRYESNAQESKLFWREMASNIYTNAVKTCFLLNKNEKAFYFIEKNKALLLLEDIKTKQLKEKANIPEELIRKQKEFKVDISNIQNQLRISNYNKDSLSQLLLNTKNRYALLSDSLQMNYPDYYKTQSPPRILKLEEAQQSLPNTNTVYISYILNNEYGYGIMVTKEKVLSFKIEDVDSLLKSVKTYRSLLESPFKSHDDIKNYNHVSYNIYNQLIPELISKEIQEKKIIIIPDYYLQNLPFESLITSDINKKYFIQSNEISYAYSITFLNENKNIKRKNTNEFLGIAPVKFNNGLVNLPNSKTEIESISKLFRSQIFTNTSATSTNFNDYSKDYEIIHFATHASANDSLSPWISFSDKKMTLNDLYQTNNTANLIVLSACKTSLGEINKGEGVMSLARGFFNTGANAVISTLWNVNDKSSSEILTSFYKEIKKGKSKSGALRQAKLNYLNTHTLSETSPYYWSSLILIGDRNSIDSLYFDWTYFIFLLIFLIALFLFIKKTKLVGNN